MFVHIILAKQTAESIERFERAVRMHPQVLECFAIIGNADYHLKIDASNIDQYEALRESILSRLPGVRSIKVNVPIRRIAIRAEPAR